MSKTVLLVCSGGGHWIQMSKLISAFDGLKIIVATTDVSFSVQYDGIEFVKIQDFNRKKPFKSFFCFFKILNLFVTRKPDFIISTGAAPGLVGLFIGKIFCKKTIWIDSIANVKKISMSGKLASYFVDRIYTQWPDLAGKYKSIYSGRVI